MEGKKQPSANFDESAQSLKCSPNDSDSVSGVSRPILKTRFEEPIDDDLDDDKKIHFSQDENMQQDDSSHHLHRPTFAEEIEQVAMRLLHRPCPITCQKYLNVEDFAELFVDEIIQTATGRTLGIKELSAIKIVDGVEYKDEDSNDSNVSVNTYVCVLEWPTIAEFNVELGQHKLLEFISYWTFKEGWKYAILYLKGESDQTSDFHYYEAMFSIPCKQYPIPQATASVYFTFEVSRVRPKHCLVDVDFCFEGQRFRHKPSNFTFQEIFLFNIIDAKISLYKTLTF